MTNKGLKPDHVLAYGAGLRARMRQIEAQACIINQREKITATGSIEAILPQIKQLAVNKKPVETSVGFEVRKTLKSGSIIPSLFIKAQLDHINCYLCINSHLTPSAHINLY